MRLCSRQNRLRHQAIRVGPGSFSAMSRHKIIILALLVVLFLLVFVDAHARGGSLCYTYECRQNRRLWSYILYPLLAIGVFAAIGNSIKKNGFQRGFINPLARNVLPYIAKFASVIGIVYLGSAPGEEWLLLVSCAIGFYLTWIWFFRNE
jgi:hypothetical protein